ncbi:MAG: hypothetical protein R6U98_18040 [Pirellulaceae bacterium]
MEEILAMNTWDRAPVISRHKCPVSSGENRLLNFVQHVALHGKTVHCGSMSYRQPSHSKLGVIWVSVALAVLWIVSGPSISRADRSTSSSFGGHAMGAALLGHWMHRAAICLALTPPVLHRLGIPFPAMRGAQDISTTAFNRTLIQPGGDAFFSMAEVEWKMARIRQSIVEEVRESGQVPLVIHDRQPVKTHRTSESILDWVIATASFEYQARLKRDGKYIHYEITWTLEDEVDANDFEQRRGNGSFRDWSNPLDDAIDAVEVAADLLMDKALHANYKISVSKNTNLVIEK